MKNNIFYTFIVIFFFFSLNLFSEELEINSDKIQYDDVSKISIFEGNVNIKDENYINNRNESRNRKFII